MSDPTRPLLRLPTSRKGWGHLLTAISVRPSKGMGQNFLVERGVVERIVKTAKITPGDHIIEVGPGLGILTAHLLQAGARVDAIELDRELAAHMKATFGDIPELQIHEADALKFDISTLLTDGKPYSLVANLPYSIASAVIMYFLEQPTPPERITVMIQHEVAERLVAGPPDMTVLSVATQVLSIPRIAFAVTPGNFVPPPKVDSSVVSIAPLGDKRLAASRRPLFFRLVNGGFRHKRKQILNSLAFEVETPKAEIIVRLESAGIDPLRRAQTLTVDEWLRLLDSWERAEQTI